MRNLSRRGFLRIAGGSAAALAVASAVPASLIPKVEATPTFKDPYYGIGMEHDLLVRLQEEMNYRLAMTLETLNKLTSA